MKVARSKFAPRYHFLSSLLPSQNLFPTWTVTLSHENVLQIQKLEEERKLTDLRREKAKEAFGREKALRDAVEKKRQDLAMAQLMEHNEEMERTTRR